MRSSCRLIKSKISIIAVSAIFLLSLTSSADARNPFNTLVNNENQSVLLAQFPQENYRIRRAENNAVTGGGSMSNRFRKYMNQEGGEPADNGRRGRFKQRFSNLSNEDKAALRSRLQNMSPQERRQFMMNMRKRRGGMGKNSRQPGMGNRSRGGRRNRHVRNHSRRSKKSGMRGGRSWFNRKPLDLGPLGLSEKQKTRIKTFRQSNSVKARAVNKRLRAQRSRMRSIMFDPSATRKDIMLQKNQLRSLQNQAEDIMINDFLSIREVLSKEQLQMLPEIAPGRRRKARKAPPKVAPAIGQEAKGSGI